MKHTFTFLAAILITAGLFAQTPAKMTYQTVIRNANGELVSTQVGMKISILQGADADTATASEVYSESLRPTPNQNGLLSIEFGGETGWNAINWSEGTYFIKTETDLTGGNNYTITGISQLLSVPYALHAKTAETATNIRLRGSETAFEGWDKNENDDFSGNYNDLSNLPDLNNFLRAEQDGDVTNELQILSISGDTIYLSNGGGFVKLPPNSGFSGSYHDLTDLPPNLDTDLTNDFSGNYNDLSNLPAVPDVSSFVTQTALENLETYLEELRAEIEELKIEKLLQNGLTDSRDSNAYSVVKIGEQIWMAENLAYEIPSKEITDNTAWENNTSYDAWCYMDNDKVSNGGKYGVLYQWEAAKAACPSGWHLPTDEEWTELENYLADNGYNYDGTTGGGRDKIAKAIAETWGWYSAYDLLFEDGSYDLLGFLVDGDAGHNQISNNRSDFSALPGGTRFYYGEFSETGYSGIWWSGTAKDNSNSWGRRLDYNDLNLSRENGNNRFGFSVRCLMNISQ